MPRCLGGQRLHGAFAFRRLLDAGARLAFGSDWPVVSLDPLAGIRAAVTGLTLAGDVFGADQNLTVDESLRAYTAGAAYALGLDDA
ncbi:MAG: amidohydrolase family protein, partial [Planctomycetota bacterium]